MANGKSLTKNGHGTPIPAIWVDQLICCTEVQFFLCWLLVKPPLCYHWRISTGPASAVLNPCDQRRHIGWLTTSVDHMNISHVTTDDYYYSRTQCVRDYSNGRGTVTTESAKFYFDTLPKIH